MSCGMNFVKNNCKDKNDYICQRKCNIFKLKELYSKELDNYYNSYATYLRFKYSTGANSELEKKNAEIEWRPKIGIINSRLTKILTDIKANINHTQSLIGTQEAEIEIKNNNIFEEHKKIDNLSNLINKHSDEYVSKERQVLTGKERNISRRNSMYFLIILNIILIGIIGYFLTKS